MLGEGQVGGLGETLHRGYFLGLVSWLYSGFGGVVECTHQEAQRPCLNSGRRRGLSFCV